ncbi:hypothetical protein JCM15519_06910 [Fundidesulfovibrio butyratiphilus]
MDWDAISAEALNAITEVGADAIMRRAGEQGEFDPETGRYAEGDPTETSCKAVLTDYSLKMIDGDLIKLGDRLAIVPAQGLAEPDPTRDTLIIKGESWNVVRAKVVDPGGVAILYKVQVRK